MESKSLAQVYSSKTDDELIALAANLDALVQEVRPILADELLRRNLTSVQSSRAGSEYEAPALRNMAVGRLFRAVGAFVLNLAVAFFGTAMIESSIWSQIGRARSIAGIERREWFLSLTIAALLGFFMRRRWQTKSAMWVWVLPVTFFALGVLMYGAKSRSVLAGGFSEHFFAPNCVTNSFECRDFLLFTIPAARTVAYSVAARVSLHFQTRTARAGVPRT